MLARIIFIFAFEFVFVTVSVRIIGVGFCHGQRQLLLQYVCQVSTFPTISAMLAARITARWRPSDELAFYGPYHALVGHIMAAKTRPAGMTNCLFIGGKPPV